MSSEDYFSEGDFEFDDFGFDDNNVKYDKNIAIVDKLNAEYRNNSIPININYSNEIANITFNLNNLNPEYIQSLDMDINKPLKIKVIITGPNYEIRDIENAGILEYPIKRSKNDNLETIINSILEWLNNPGKWCPICGQENITAGSRPVTCSLATCRFVASELTGLVNLSKYIPSHYQLIDLLWALLYTAVKFKLDNDVLKPFPEGSTKSKRNNDVVDPFPEGFLRDGQKDWQLLDQVLKALPRLEEVVQNITIINTNLEIIDKNTAVENYLRALNINIPYLIRWLLGTLRAHLIYVSSTINDTVLSSNCQKTFNMIAESPERMAAFQQLSLQYPVVDAYHGSPIENWHSILRHSLRNYSCTERQLHGAAYGKGIYLAPNINTAKGYARGNGISWDKSEFNGLRILLKAQVINYDIKTVNDFCYVIEDENKVRITALCLFK